MSFWENYGLPTGLDLLIMPTKTLWMNFLWSLSYKRYEMFFLMWINRLRGNHTHGYSEDEPEKPARTALVQMITFVMGSDAFVVRLTQSFSLKSDFLHEKLLCTVHLISECGGRAVALKCDCLSTNQKCYKIFKQNFSYENSKPWKIRHPSNQNKTLFLLHDTAH